MLLCYLPVKQTEVTGCFLSFGVEFFAFQFAIQIFKRWICRTIILPVVFYGCETWSLTLREERGLGVFENSVLWGIFEPKRYKVTGEWRKLHNEELDDLYSTNSVRVIKSRRMRWAGHVERTRWEEKGIQGFGGETGGKETTWETQV